jgi:hypothetical protein
MREKWPCSKPYRFSNHVQIEVRAGVRKLKAACLGRVWFRTAVCYSISLDLKCTFAIHCLEWALLIWDFWRALLSHKIHSGPRIDIKVSSYVGAVVRRQSERVKSGIATPMGFDGVFTSTGLRHLFIQVAH